MKKHIYLAVENVGLNDTQRDTLIDVLKKLGPKWSSREELRYTPIVQEWDNEDPPNLISESGGDPYMETIYFHNGLPAHYCHWKPRNDKQAVILEALFEEENLTVGFFKEKLGDIFNVDPDTIDSVTQHTQYGPVVTFSRSGDRIKFLLFGGINATWQESGDACRAFLSANRTEWADSESI